MVVRNPNFTDRILVKEMSFINVTRCLVNFKTILFGIFLFYFDTIMKSLLEVILKLFDTWNMKSVA
jgi:hypothetical protein